MAIHKNYARLNAADRAVIDEAVDAARDVFKQYGREASGTDPCERMAEAMATYLIESGGHAMLGTGPNHTAPAGGEQNPTYA